jgi:hypothetical protein
MRFNLGRGHRKSDNDRALAPDFVMHDSAYLVISRNVFFGTAKMAAMPRFCCEAACARILQNTAAQHFLSSYRHIKSL